MKRPERFLATASALCVAGLLASVATAAPTVGDHRSTDGLDSATLSACVSAATAAQSSATFSAQMSAVPGTRSMEISFDLYERTSAAEPYAPVSAPGFGVWQSSNPGIASFTANENVVDLPVPGAFRAVVDYRWLSRHARVIRRDQRVTPVCAITGAVSDLSITRIARVPGSPLNPNELFKVTIRNRGELAAGAFAVTLSDAGAALPQLSVAGLAAGTSTTLEFSGPRCSAGAAITAQIEPSGATTEPASPDHTVTTPCPPPLGASGASGTNASS
jgi:hypothetical protein